MLKSLFHWKVLLNFVIAIGLFVGLTYLTFRWLEFHTKHGKEIPVPNVVNLSLKESIKILDDVGLTYEIDSTNYDPKYKSLQVLQTYPTAGSHVKSDRTIRLKVNPSTWAKVSVPNILNKYKNTAFSQLERIGLKVGDTIYEPSIQPDAVIRMFFHGEELKPGALLPRFSEINLVIGSGPMRNIMIPNTVGLTVREAKTIIEQNHFSLGVINFEDGQNNMDALVYYQDPAANDIRDQGQQIDLWASNKTPAEMYSKIEQLNRIYRVKVTPSNSYYEDDMVLKTPPVTKTIPKPETKSVENQEKKPKAKPLENKPEHKEKEVKEEKKPKAKKIIIE